MALKFIKDGKMNKLILVLTLFFIITLKAVAQIYWQQTNGPYGGDILSLLRNDNGNLFAGTRGKGLFISVDNGKSWNRIKNFPHSDVFTLAQNSIGEIFAGTNEALYKSTDHGINWNNITANSNYYSAALALTIDKENNIYFGDYTWNYKSTDDGESWNKISGDESYNHSVLSIGVDNKGYIYYTASNGFFLSRDGGLSWQQVIVNDTINNFGPILIDSDDDILTGTNYGIIKSTDNGASWRFIRINDQNMVYALNLNESRSGTIYACSNNSIYVSTDKGESWVKIIGEPPYTYINDLITDTTGNILVGTSKGFYFSRDGKNWEQNNTGIINTTMRVLEFDRDGNLFAGTSSGIFKSSDLGEHWELSSSNLLYVYDIEMNSHGHIFAATSSGIIRSKDKGMNWTLLTTGLSDRFIHSLAININDDIYAASQYFIFKSTNNGEAWEKVNIGIDSLYVYDITINNNGCIFIGGFGDLVKSTDNGLSWNHNNPGLTNKYISSLNVTPSGEILAGTQFKGGIFHSVNNGSSWFQINGGQKEFFDIKSIYSNKYGDLFIITEKGIFRSTNNGSTWEDINNDISIGYPGYINCMTSASDGTFFIGTYNSGVFKTTLPVLEPLANDYRLHQNFPNPFNITSTVQYELPVDSKVSIKLYDILGREIKTIYEGELQQGRYFAIIDGHNLASGIYLVRMKTNKYSKTIKTVFLK